VGIVAVPLFALAFGAQKGSAILLPLMIAADVFSVYHHWGTWDKKLLKLLGPGTLTGIAAGSVILWLIIVGRVWPWQYDWSHWGDPLPEAAKAARASSAGVLNLLTGVVCVAYVGLEMIRARYAPRWHFTPTARTGFAAGGAVGVISTLAHAAGPVAAIFLLNQGLSRSAFMGTTVIYFFGINTVKLAPYGVIPGLIDRESLWIGLCFLALVPVGTRLGKWMFDRMSEKFFRNLILVITAVSGVQLIVDYVRG